MEKIYKKKCKVEKKIQKDLQESLSHNMEIEIPFEERKIVRVKSKYKSSLSLASNSLLKKKKINLKIFSH